MKVKLHFPGPEDQVKINKVAWSFQPNNLETQIWVPHEASQSEGSKEEAQIQKSYIFKQTRRTQSIFTILLLLKVIVLDVTYLHTGTNCT